MATQRRNRRQEPANSLLYRPDSLEPLELNVSADVLLETTNNILTNQLNESQEIVFRNSFTNRVTLLWGPPGTGKTTLLGAIIIGWLKKVKIENQGTSIVVGSSNWNAIDNLLDEVAELIEYLKGEEEGFNDIEIHRVRGKSSSKSDNPLINDTIVGAGANTLVNDLDDGEKMIIVGSTWKQLHNLAKPDFRYNNPSQPKEWFDLVLIDEASQVKVSQAAQYFVLMKNIGNVIFAGDDKQLGPIFGFEIDNNSDGLYDCIYTYMKNTHNLVPQIIKSNYRSNEEIVNWPRSRFYDGEIEAINSMKRLDIELPDSKPEDWPEELIWNDNYLSILDPEVPIVLITYPSKPFTVSNPFESQITSALSWL